METTSPNVITLKLLIDTKGKRVLFAEAGKDFIDFLFSLLSVTVGTIIKLLSTNGIDMVGSLGKLYQSLENLSPTYIQPNFDKDILLNPKPSVVKEGSSATILSLTNNVTTSKVKKFYSCNTQCSLSSYSSYNKEITSTCHNRYVSDDPRAICPGCKTLMNKGLTYVSPPATQVGSSSSFGADQSGGFVRGVVTYMITDDLDVKPMSTISSIALPNSFNVKEICSLQEKTVSVGINEGLNLLKASLHHTKSVLTHVFLKKREPIPI